jgi:hypothetical protein
MNTPQPSPAAPPPARGALARIVGAALWVAAAGFVIGSVQVWRALRTGQDWGNYRGELLTSAELRHTLVLFIVAAALCTLLAWRWQRTLRRGGP